MAMEDTDWGARGQGRQELHRHRVPLRLPPGQEAPWASSTRTRTSDRSREPIGVVLALLPITNPTSTALFKSIVATKTRNAMIMRPSAAPRVLLGARDEILQAAGETRPAARRAPGDPRPDARRLPVPLPSRRSRLHLDDRGSEGRRRRQRRRQAVPERRLGQRAGLRAPQRRHRDGGRGHPRLQDVRLLGDLPGRADSRDRRCVYEAMIDEFRRWARAC